MNEWAQYHPGELLLFSERVYWRLFVLHNDTWWPWQFAAVALGAGLILVTARPNPVRLRLGLAALCALWGLVAVAYLSARNATINWTAHYAVPVFVLEGLMLVAAAGFPEKYLSIKPSRPTTLLATALVVYAVALHPLTALFRDSGLAGAEVFGLTPDPLAIATLGATARLGYRPLAAALALIPSLWLLISALTLYGLESNLAVIPLVAVLIGWPVLIRSK